MFRTATAVLARATRRHAGTARQLSYSARAWQRADRGVKTGLGNDEDSSEDASTLDENSEIQVQEDSHDDGTGSSFSAPDERPSLSEEEQDIVRDFIVEGKDILGEKPFMRLLTLIKRDIQTGPDIDRLSTKLVQYLRKRKAVQEKALNIVEKKLEAAKRLLHPYYIDCILHLIQTCNEEHHHPDMFAEVLDLILQSKVRRPDSLSEVACKLDMYDLPSTDPTPYKVWIWGLPGDMTERSLAYSFDRIGNVVKVDLARNVPSMIRRKQLSRRKRPKAPGLSGDMDWRMSAAGIIYFDDPVGMERALTPALTLFGILLDEFRCKTNTVDKMTLLYVCGLPEDLTEDKLQELLRGVKSVSPILPRSMRKPEETMSCTIEFENPTDLIMAYTQLRDVVINGPDGSEKELELTMIENIPKASKKVGFDTGFSLSEFTSATIPIFRKKNRRRTGVPRLLSQESVLELKKALESDQSERGDGKRLANEFGVSASTICDIKSGRTWGYIKVDSEDNGSTASAESAENSLEGAESSDDVLTGQDGEAVETSPAYTR